MITPKDTRDLYAWIRDVRASIAHLDATVRADMRRCERLDDLATEAQIRREARRRASRKENDR